jgi:hypothetical protein
VDDALGGIDCIATLIDILSDYLSEVDALFRSWHADRQATNLFAGSGSGGQLLKERLPHSPTSTSSCWKAPIRVRLPIAANDACSIV